MLIQKFPFTTLLCKCKCCNKMHAGAEQRLCKLQCSASHQCAVLDLILQNFLIRSEFLTTLLVPHATSRNLIPLECLCASCRTKTVKRMGRASMDLNRSQLQWAFVAISRMKNEVEEINCWYISCYICKVYGSVCGHTQFSFGCRHCVCRDEAELFWYIENSELLKVPNLKSGSIFV